MKVRLGWPDMQQIAGKIRLNLMMSVAVVVSPPLIPGGGQKVKVQRSVGSVERRGEERSGVEWSGVDLTADTRQLRRDNPGYATVLLGSGSHSPHSTINISCFATCHSHLSNS